MRVGWQLRSSLSFRLVLVGTAAGKLGFPELLFILRKWHGVVLRVVVSAGGYRQCYYQAFRECGKAIVRMIVRIVKRGSVSRDRYLNWSFVRSSEWSSEFLSEMVVTWSNILPQHILHSTMNYCVFCYGGFRRDTNMPRIHYRFTEKQEIDRYSWFVSDRISQHYVSNIIPYLLSHTVLECA